MVHNFGTYNAFGHMICNFADRVSLLAVKMYRFLVIFAAFSTRAHMFFIVLWLFFSLSSNWNCAHFSPFVRLIDDATAKNCNAFACDLLSVTSTSATMHIFVYFVSACTLKINAPIQRRQREWTKRQKKVLCGQCNHQMSAFFGVKHFSIIRNIKVFSFLLIRFC